MADLSKTTNFAIITPKQLKRVESLVDNRRSGVWGEGVGLLFQSGSEVFIALDPMGQSTTRLALG